MVEDIIARITRLQRELAGMRDFQRRYLERRAARGIATATDSTMQSHQETITETLDLLEAMKAMQESDTEEKEVVNALQSERFLPSERAVCPNHEQHRHWQ